MVEKFNSKLLEVVIQERGSESWEWRVHLNGRVLVCGFETSRLEASFAGNDAMFLILQSGRNL